MNKTQKAKEWTEAIQRCHLSQEAVEMARELGFAPESLVKNIPSKSQPWKAPVEEWVRDLYHKREIKRKRKAARLEKARPGEMKLSEAEPQKL